MFEFIVWSLILLMTFIVGAAVGARWQKNVFAAEKAVEEETARLVAAAKRRYKKVKETDSPPPK